MGELNGESKKPVCSWKSEKLEFRAMSLREMQSVSFSMPQIQSLYREAETIYKNRCEERSSSTLPAKTNFLLKACAEGTLKDRVAAMTVVLSDREFIYQLPLLDELLKLLHKNHKDTQKMAAEGLRAIFLTILPPNQTLSKFTEHRLEAIPEAAEPRKRTLFYLYVEDFVKNCFISTIDVLEKLLHDPIDSIRSYFVSYVSALLEKIPEQSGRLLSLLIHKLGDHVPKIASKALYHLVNLVELLPRLQGPLITGIQDFLFVGNKSVSGRTYAIDALNACIPLIPSSQWKTANQLLGCYFAMFKFLVRQEYIESRLMQRLLSGVKRIFPKTKPSSESVQQHLRACFSIAAMANFSHRVAALSMLFQILSNAHKMDTTKEDKKKQVLLKEKQQQENQNLDEEDDEAPADDEQPSTTAAAVGKEGNGSTDSSVPAGMRVTAAKLTFDQHLKKIFFNSDTFKTRFYQSLYFLLRERPENMPSNATKIAGLFSLLYHALLADSNQARIAAFVHRLLQVCSQHSPSFCCAAIFMIEELAKKHTFIRNHLSCRLKTPSSDHSPYDMLERAPDRASAQHENTWLTNVLNKHYHPQVIRFSTFMMNDLPIDYDGDPLDDFSIAKFLDTFIYKHPKAKLKENIKEAQKKKRSKTHINITSKSFADLSPDKVELDKIFAYKWVKQKEQLFRRQRQIEKQRREELGIKKFVKKPQTSFDNLLETLHSDGEHDDDDDAEMYEQDSDDADINPDDELDLEGEDDLDDFAEQLMPDFDSDEDEDITSASTNNKAMSRQERRQKAREAPVWDPTVGSLEKGAHLAPPDLNDLLARREKSHKERKRKRADDDDDDFLDDFDPNDSYDTVPDDVAVDDGVLSEEDAAPKRARKKVVKTIREPRHPQNTVKKIQKKNLMMEIKKQASTGLAQQIAEKKGKKEDSRLWE